MRPAFAAAILMLAPAVALAQTDAGTYRASSELNVRAAAGIQAELLGVIPSAGTVTVFRCDAFGWCQVQYQDLQGWAARQFLVRTGDLPPDALTLRVGSPAETLEADVAGGPIEVSGQLAAGTPCTTLLTEDGTEYALLGNVPFSPAAPVRVVGQAIATDACGTATALAVLYVRIAR